MRKLLLGGFLSGLSALSLLAATTPLYINNAPLLAPPALPPQIDATAFLNRSTFDVNPGGLGFIVIVGDIAVSFGNIVPPYKMMNTRFVTNAPGASMSGTPGFQFDFFNSSNSILLGLDTFENRGTITADPLIKVLATNIFSRGPLQVTDLGLIKLQGTNVDLRRSTLLAGVLATAFPDFGGGINGTNHFNARGVNDIYWGNGINNRVTNGAPPVPIDNFNTTNFITPAHQIIRLAGGGLFTNLTTIPALVSAGFTPFVYTNENPAQVQIVYVNTNSPDPLLTTEVRFVPGNANDGADVIIAIESQDFDILSGNTVTNGVYFVDHSAFTTNIGVTWNGGQFLGQRRTRRPDTYEFFRQRPFGWNSPGATNGNSDITNITFYSTNVVSNTVQMAYAAYSASWAGPAFTNIVTTPIFGGPPAPVIPPPGRVEIFGDRVSLDRTRIKAETTVTIKARDLASNAVAQVDAPILEFDLASTSPPLVISNLAPASVRRFSGQFRAWTGVWDKIEFDPADTNITYTTQFSVLVFDHFASAETTVSTTDLLLAADQIAISDEITISRAIRIDARDWTVTTNLTLPPAGYSLGASNLIGLVNFTNRDFGIINVSGRASFGREAGVTPLENYVIAPGTIFFAAGHDIGAANVQLGGTLSANAGGISILADSVSLSGLLTATSDIDISADVVTASNSFITAGGLGVPASLIFDVPGSLTDAGAGTSERNEWTAHGGIQMLSRPATGDLLGTTVRVPLANFGEALIRWPATDFGPSAGGFANNLALSTLVLDGGSFSLFRFEGPGAIYIDRLELIGEPASFPDLAIEIAPDMAVYFADSNVDPTTLDGLHGGRLRFVSSFAGPLNSTNIVYPSGETYTFNAALVRSTTLDSDGDGIVNALDSTPVIVGDRIDLKIACSRGSATRRTVISWMAPANSTSVVEYKDSLHATTWQALPAVQNTGAAQRLSVSEDLPATAAGQRFYRVRTQE